MPSIKRQTPPALPSAPTALPPANGSLLATAIPVTELREERVKVCIYGRNRSGKTTLASQFPKPLLFISCEPAHCGGVQSIANTEGVKLIQITAERTRREDCIGSNKIVAIAAELAQSRYYQTVILKTATSLQDLILVELLGSMPELLLKGTVSKDTYQQRAEKWREVTRKLLDLNHLHVVIIAQEKDHNPQSDDFGGKSKLLHTMQQGSFMAPALGATNAQWLQDACGYVLQLYEDETTQEIVVPQMDMHGNPLPPSIQRVGTGKRQRHLRLLYHPNFAAGGKWRYDPGMPEFVTAPDPKGLYAAMAQYIPALR